MHAKDYPARLIHGGGFIGELTNGLLEDSQMKNDIEITNAGHGVLEKSPMEDMGQ